MSQKVSYKQFITNRPRQLNTLSPTIKRNHIFRLDFDQGQTKKSTVKYKTIDQILTWKSTRSKFVSKYGRKTTTKIGQSDLDMMESMQLSKINEGNQIISYRDKEHFQYLVKALTGIKKGKKFSQIQRYKAKDQNHQIKSLLAKQVDQWSKPNMLYYQSQLPQEKISRNHFLVNDGLYKKMPQHQLKNGSKRKVIKQDQGILGSEQLKINRISWGHLKGKGN